MIRKGFRIPVALALVSAVLSINPSYAWALSWSGDCTASKSYANYGVYIIWTGTHVDLIGTVSGSKVTVQKVNYSMGSPWYQLVLPPGPPLPWLDGTGNHNNVNVTSPVSRYSPDSLGGGGTYDFADFTVNSNSNVTIQLIPDIVNASDPSCKITLTVA